MSVRVTKLYCHDCKIDLIEKSLNGPIPKDGVEPHIALQLRDQHNAIFPQHLLTLAGETWWGEY